MATTPEVTNVIQEWSVRPPLGRCWCAQLPRISEETRVRSPYDEACNDLPEQDSLERSDPCLNGHCDDHPEGPDRKSSKSRPSTSGYSFFGGRRMSKSHKCSSSTNGKVTTIAEDTRHNDGGFWCGLCGGQRKGESLRSLWVILSALYGKMVVLLMVGICLTEVLDNNVRPLSLQSVYLIYLYVGSVAAILGIYVSVLLDSCPSTGKGSPSPSSEAVMGGSGAGARDPELGSLSSFGTLKRAHISRAGTSRTSFYLRVGALVFGLGTLIANGLEVAMETSLEPGCMDSVTSAVPILQALFTFLQMHFLFVNSEVLVERYGTIARFGFMHLMGTNVALWLNSIVWGAAKDWMDSTYHEPAMDFTLGGVQALKSTNDAFPVEAFHTAPLTYTGMGANATTATAIPNMHVTQMMALMACTNHTGLGQLWNSWRTLLFPFIIEYGLIAAAVTYMMWRDVGKVHMRHAPEKQSASPALTSPPDQTEGCHNASKGLFFGLLCLVGSLVITIIFYVMKSHQEFRLNLLWTCSVTQLILLSSSTLACTIGFTRLRTLNRSRSGSSADLDQLVPHTCIIGVYLYAILSGIVGAATHQASLVSVHVLLAVQVTFQSAWISEASRRCCATRSQLAAKPGRQLVTFLLFANAAMWLLDAFVTHAEVYQAPQRAFYGALVWGVVSRACLPLLVMYRFHACVVLAGIWKRAYRLRLK